MFTKNRNTTWFLVLFGLSFAWMWLYFYNESTHLQTQIQTLRASVQEYEDRLAETERERDRLRSELDDVERYISKYLLNGKYGILSKDQFASIFHIYNHTPLSLEAAAAIVYYSDYYGIRYSLILSIIEIESNFNQYLVGTSEDRGYMQIIPETEAYLVRTFGKNIGIEYNPASIFEPDYNLGLGISYIAYLYQCHGDNLDKILTEYNRGAGGLAAYYRENATYSSTYSRAVIDRQEKYVLLENQVKAEEGSEEGGKEESMGKSKGEIEEESNTHVSNSGNVE